MKITTKFDTAIFSDELRKIVLLLDGKARLVGGCVRDFVSGKQMHDIDIATEIKPDEMMQRLSSHFHVIPTGLKHGTITIIGEHKYEITTLRHDKETDGRHAVVSFEASWEEDSARRDFTMNALYADVEGNIYDYHNGVQDLYDKCVRFVGNPMQRIEEDYLRILRFFRFAMRFDNQKNFESEDYKACVRLAANLSKISKERITNEWLQIAADEYFWQFLEKLYPILGVIGLRFDVAIPEKHAQLSVLGITALFWQPGASVVFSNAQKKYITHLQALPLADLTDAIIYEREYGEAFAHDKMILENKFFSIPKLPEFPLNGRILIEHGIQGAAIGIKLDKLYRIWVEHLGQISTEELLVRLKNA